MWVGGVHGWHEHPWQEAGPLNQPGDESVPDHLAVNKEIKRSLFKEMISYCFSAGMPKMLQGGEIKHMFYLQPRPESDHDF